MQTTYLTTYHLSAVWGSAGKTPPQSYRWWHNSCRPVQGPHSPYEREGSAHSSHHTPHHHSADSGATQVVVGVVHQSKWQVNWKERHQKSFTLTLAHSLWPNTNPDSGAVLSIWSSNDVADYIQFMLSVLEFVSQLWRKYQKLHDKILNEKPRFEANWMLPTYSSVCEGKGGPALITLRALQWEGNIHITCWRETDWGNTFCTSSGGSCKPDPTNLSTEHNGWKQSHWVWLIWWALLGIPGLYFT